MSPQADRADGLAGRFAVVGAALETSPPTTWLWRPRCENDVRAAAMTLRTSGCLTEIQPMSCLGVFGRLYIG